MQALYQRLKEIDSDAFEKLAYQIFAEKYPGAKITRVDGSGGDRGIDLFSGTLADGPAIWQCKYFRDGVKDVQRRQVVKSLDTALENFSPRRWTLVIPVDLNVTEQEWFQKLKSDYSQKTTIELFQASDFVRELIQRRNIRDLTFPGSVFDTIAFLRKLEGTGAIDGASLSAATNKYLEEEIARLEEADPRFAYRVSYAPNMGFDVAAFTPLGPKHTASIVLGNKRIDVFVRDSEAARLDPPKIGFSVNGAGRAKLREFYRTGKPQQLGQDEIQKPQLPFAFALPGNAPQEWQVQLRPSQQITQREHMLRMKVFDSDEEVQYDLIKFRVLAAGSEQLELESSSNLPFTLSLTLILRADGGGDFNYAERFLGYRLSECAKAIRMKYLLRRGATVELHSLELDAPLGVLGSNRQSTVEMDGFDRALLDMAEVAAFFGWTIPFNGKIDEDDLNLLILLLAIVRGTPIPIDYLTTTIRKSESTLELVRQGGSSQLELAVFVESMTTPLSFYGVSVTTGPLLFRSRDARFVDPEALLLRVTAASEDEDIEVRFSVDEVYAERTTETIRNLYVRPIDAAETTSTPGDQDFTPTEVI
jgi:hypothetical protein